MSAPYRMLLVGVSGLLCAGGCGFAEPPAGGHGASEVVDLAPRSGVVIASEAATFEGATIRAGDRVRLRKRSGTFKPADTGHRAEVEGEAGRTGLALGGVARPGFGPEPVQVVLVRFDPQAWREWTPEAGVAPTADASLPAFEASVHVDHLQVVRP